MYKYNGYKKSSLKCQRDMLGGQLWIFLLQFVLKTLFNFASFPTTQICGITPTGKKPITKMECSICYESLAEEPAAPTAPKRGRRPDPKNPKNTSVLVCPPCGHIYHRICIEEWILTKQSTCPNCRKSFEKRALKAVFLPTAGSTAQTGNDKKDDNDDEDSDDDDGEKGKEPCGKCDKLAIQLEELKKEKEGLQKELAAEKKEVKSLQKYVQELTPSSPGNAQQSTAADEDSDPMDDDDEDGFFSVW